MTWIARYVPCFMFVRLANLFWYRWTPNGRIVAINRYVQHGAVKPKRGETVKPMSGTHGLYSVIVGRRV